MAAASVRALLTLLGLAGLTVAVALLDLTALGSRWPVLAIVVVCFSAAAGLFWHVRQRARARADTDA